MLCAAPKNEDNLEYLMAMDDSVNAGLESTTLKRDINRHDRNHHFFH